jgi:phosphate transport system substrate-binding protein
MRSATIRLLAAAGIAAAAAIPAGAQTIQLNGAGATFPAPIYTKWFSEYHNVHANVQINYQAIG